MLMFPRIVLFNVINFNRIYSKAQVTVLNRYNTIKMYTNSGVIYPKKSVNPSPVGSLSLVEQLQSERKSTAKSVLQFNFNINRVRLMTKRKDIVKGANGILYWMSRDMRVQDNWSLLFAQQVIKVF